jgi:hypothetical protein
VLDQLHSHVRNLGSESDAMQWSTLKEVFLSRDHGRAVPGQQYVWPEFGDYIGPLLLLLAFVGLATAGAQNAWLTALLGWAFLLMLGHFGKLAPWSILKGHVYPFTSMRVPSRFVSAVSMWLSLFMGIGIDRVSAWGGRVFRNRQWSDALRTAVLAIALIGVGDVVAAGIVWTAQGYPSSAEGSPAPSPRLYHGGPGISGFIDEPKQNRGRLECWEEWSFSGDAPFWAGDVPQVRAKDGAATIGEVVRTPNTFTFDVDATAPARLLVNSGYDRGWRTNVGELTSESKLLVLDVPAGHNHVVVKYWPHGLTLGMWLTGLSVLGIAAWFVRERRRG